MPIIQIQLPKIAIDCPFIADLFDPGRIAEQIAKYQGNQRSQSLTIFMDWKKVLDEEMTLEEFNKKHALTDLK